MLLPHVEVNWISKGWHS